jgi:8-oxo-dGTP diphosphatase
MSIFMAELSPENNREYPLRPIVAVSALIIRDGSILLVKRANEPNKGKWSLPGGKLELGETVRQAAEREALEECSVRVMADHIFEVTDHIIHDDAGRVKYHYVLIDLIARYISGEARAQSDAAECRWFTIKELDKLDTTAQLRSVIMRAISQGPSPG